MISLTTSKTLTTNSKVVETNETPGDLPTGRVGQVLPGAGALKPGCHHDGMHVIINGMLSTGTLTINSFDLTGETFSIPVDADNSITYKFINVADIESGTLNADGEVQVNTNNLSTQAEVTDQIIKAVNSVSGNNEGSANSKITLIDSDLSNSYTDGDSLTITLIHNTINSNDNLSLISGSEKIITDGFSGSSDNLSAKVESWVGDQLTLDTAVNIPAGTTIFKEWDHHHGTKAEFLRKKLLGLI